MPDRPPVRGVTGDGGEGSHPPSDPHPSFSRPGGGGAFAAEDRPVRVQLLVALVLGLFLIASGLYVWRRPSQTTEAGGAEAAAIALEAGLGDASAPVATVDAAPPPVVLSEARVVGCHDRGPKVTAPSDCDRLAPIEAALARAIEQSVACYPPGADGASIEYVADIRFARHKVRVTMPRSGRSARDRHVVNGCGTAVREAIQTLELDGIEHQHARYEIAITANYRGRG